MIDQVLQAYRGSEYDFRTIANPADPFAARFPEWVAYYRMKAAIAQALQPARILEIGVRYGYAAAAFLQGAPRAHYTGIDLDADSFGGERGAINWARKILPAAQHELIVADTQKMPRLPGGRYDLVHVDGQQDEAGTFHDLVLAIRQARHILVDGYFWTKANHDGVNDFLWRFREDIEYFWVIPGYAGEMLIKVREPGADGGPPENVSSAPSSAEVRGLYTADYFLKECGGWEFYDQKPGAPLLDGRLRSLLDLMTLRPARRVLDLGAGRGELTLQAAAAGAEVTAVDYSPASIEIIRQSLAQNPALAPRVTLVCGDAATFSSPEKFDLVIAADLIEHLAPAELERLYANVASLLAPGGWFIVHTFPNRWFYDYAHARRRESARRAGAHVPANPRSRYELLMHLNEQSPRVLRRSLQRHFPAVRLWFGSPENPGGSLLQHATPRELAEFRDLYAIASFRAPEDDQIRQVFRMNPVTDRRIRLELLEPLPATAATNQTLRCRLRVINESAATLASRPPCPVHLSYRWKDAADRLLPLEGWRTPLIPALEPGGRRDYTVQVVTPPGSGPHQLIFSVVQEGQFWLSDAAPAGCPQCRISILPS